MNFIKKIADKNFDNTVHMQFMKFSRGEFRDRATIRAKHSAGKYTINTGPEFAPDMVRTVAEKLKDKRTNVTGAIVSTSDLKGKIDFKEISQFQGVKRYIIDKEMSGNEILKLLDDYPKTFFALSFEGGDSILKIKPKAPKSGKPGTKGEADEIKADFCKLITTDANLARSFVFEKPDFKLAEITHTYMISDIVIPAELKNEKDFAKVREMARRKGKIIREATIDEKKMNSELDFEA